MFVRLGFAVAVHVDPDVLLIDEVLAVGDEGFQQKCLDRVNAFKNEGRTIIFVTHVVDQVRRICTEAVMLRKGKVHVSGDPEDVVREYRRQLLQRDVSYAVTEGTKEIEIVSAELVAPDGSAATKLRPGDSLTIQVDLKAHKPVDDPVVGVVFHDQHNVYMFGARTDEWGANLGRVEGKKRVRFHLSALPYTSGKYWVTLGVHSRDNERVYHMQEQRYTFEVPAVSENPPVAHIPIEVEVEDL